MINGHTNGKYLDDRSLDPFWERAAALGSVGLSASGRPGCTACRPSTDTTCWCGRCGAGAWRPARTRCASSAAACSIAIRKPSWCSAISARRCRSISGALTAARRRTAGTCRSRRRNTSRERLGDDSPACMTPPPVRCSLDALGRDRVMFSADYPFDCARVRSVHRHVRRSTNPCGRISPTTTRQSCCGLSASVRLCGDIELAQTGASTMNVSESRS